MMDRREFRCILICLLISFLFFVHTAAAENNANITDIALVNSEQDVLAFFSVQDGFTVEMEKGIKNGIPVTFTFFIELHQSGGAKRKITSHNFDHTLNYDSLKQEFHVEIEEKNNRIIKTKKLTEAQSVMTMVHDFKLCELRMLKPGASYNIKIRAQLAQKKLPLNFQHLIPFWKPWDFETKWHQVAFTYTPSSKFEN